MAQVRARPLAETHSTDVDDVDDVDFDFTPVFTWFIWRESKKILTPEMQYILSMKKKL